jgi:excisionase family DNA binding protein
MEGDRNHGPGAAAADNSDGWLTKTEAAVYTRVSVDTLERAVRRGELQAGGTPGRRLFRRAWLDAWLGAVVIMLVLALACALGLDYCNWCCEWLQ